MAIDKNCAIKVGTHTAPYWTLIDADPNWRVCTRHALQYVESGIYGTLEFIQVEPKE